MDAAPRPLREADHNFDTKPTEECGPARTCKAVRHVIYMRSTS